MSASLEWNLTRQGSSLHVDYTITNRSTAPLWIVDDMLTWTQGALTRAPAAFIVRKSDAPGVASLFRGNLNIPTHDERMYPSPGMREVAVGASLTGAGDIPLPLRAWHNYHPDKIAPLAAGTTRVALEITVLRAQGVEGKDWQYETLADGSRVASPFLRVIKEQGEVITADVKEVP